MGLLLGVWRAVLKHAKGKGKVLVASAGSFILTGLAAQLAGPLLAGTGSFLLTGSDAVLVSARLLNAGTGSYTETGTAATLVYTPSGPTTLLLDHFTDTNGTGLAAHTMDTGPGWTVVGGTWTIQSNAGQCAGVAANVAVSDSGQSDVTITCIMTTGGGHQGLSFRFTDSNNYLFWSDGNIWQRNAGSESALGSATAASAGDTFKVVLSGTTLTGYINGTQNWQLTGVSFNQSATKHGLYDDGHTVSFDDFQVTSP